MQEIGNPFVSTRATHYRVKSRIDRPDRYEFHGSTWSKLFELGKLTHARILTRHADEIHGTEQPKSTT